MTYDLPSSTLPADRRRSGAATLVAASALAGTAAAQPSYDSAASSQASVRLPLGPSTLSETGRAAPCNRRHADDHRAWSGRGVVVLDRRGGDPLQLA